MIVVGMEAPLLEKAPGELRIRERIEEPDHTGRNGGVLDALGHSLSDARLLGVEADEEAKEVRLLQQCQELGVVGEIDRGLRCELKRIAVPPQPRPEVRQKLL